MSTDENKAKNENVSGRSHDPRSIQQIIYEKATFGVCPVAFQLTPEGDATDSWHPINWSKHPHLNAIRFSDGSVVFVDSNEEGQKVADAMSDLAGEFDKNWRESDKSRRQKTSPVASTIFDSPGTTGK